MRYQLGASACVIMAAYLCWAQEFTLDGLIAHFNAHPEFSCTLRVSEASDWDTVTYNGFVAKGKTGFFAALGSDYYLQKDTLEILAWTDGSDAVAAQGLPFFDISRLFAKLRTKYDVVSHCDKKTCTVVGTRLNKTDKIREFTLNCAADYTLKSLTLEYDGGTTALIAFESFSFKVPDPKLFELPKGVSVVR